MRSLKDPACAEDSQVPEGVDGNGDQEIAFQLISHSKEKATHDLGHRQASIHRMDQYKEKSTEHKSGWKSPASQKTVNEASKKDFFSDRRYHPPDKKE
jgi:hypothetical protein